MNNRIMMVLAAAMMVGCEDTQTHEWPTTQVALAGVAGLEDCLLIKVETPSSMPNLYVVRCPNSVTTSGWTERRGKSSVTRAVTIDDGGSK